MKKVNHRIKNILKLDSGQIVLILVLVSVVGLMIGLSLISRTITDVRISSQIEQSNRAFSAAEAGIESGLKGGVAGGLTGTVNLPGVSATYDVSSLGGTSSVYSFPFTDIGAARTVWLVSHNEEDGLDEAGALYPADSPLDICWGASEPGTAAMIVTLFYKDGGTYKIAKGSYDPDSSRGNNFTIADSVGDYCEGKYRFKKTITATADFGLPLDALLLILKLQPVYAATSLAVKPGSGIPLPVQGKVITSIAQTETAIVRKIKVTQSYKVLPLLLDFTLFTEE